MSFSLQKFYFLDWFGHLIDYDMASERLFRRVFSSEPQMPNLYISLEAKPALPSRHLLQTSNGTPPHLPEIRIEDAGKGRIALRENKGSLCYLTINPASEWVAFATTFLQDCERFLPLNDQTLTGMRCLFSPEKSEILDCQTLKVTQAHFQNAAGDTGCVGHKNFSISRNLSVFRHIAALEKGTSQTFFLKTTADDLKIKLTKH